MWPNISQVNVAVVPKVPMVVDPMVVDPMVVAQVVVVHVVVPKVPVVVDPMVVAQVVVVPKPPMELAQEVDRHNKDSMQPLLRQ